jgi:ribosome assembly protein 3
MSQSNKKKQNDQEINTAFDSYYLQQATKEFAEDLDKVRAADDFKNDAVTVLVHALRQGTDLFTVDEKRKIVSAAPVSGGDSDQAAEESS